MNIGKMALVVVGAVVGAFTGGMGWYAIGIGMAIGSMAGRILFPDKLPGRHGPRLQMQKVQSSASAQPIYRAYGTVRFAGNLIWSSGLIETKHKKKYGGKGGPVGTETTYSYRVHLALALCEGPIVGIANIWADAVLVYSAGALTNAVTLVARDRKVPSLKVYRGDDAQDPDPTIQSYQGVANTPAFRGLAYVVCDDFQLEKFGNRIPNFTFEVVCSGTTTSRLAGTYSVPLPGAHDATWAKGAFHCGNNRLGAVTVAQFDWDTQYENNTVAVSTVYPNGKIVDGIKIVTGAVGSNAMPQGHSDVPCVIVHDDITGGPAVRYFELSQDGKRIVRQRRVVIPGATNFNEFGAIYVKNAVGYFWCYPDGTKGNFVAKVNAVSNTAVKVFDVAAAGYGTTLHDIFVGDSQIYGVLSTNHLLVWDLNFNLIRDIAFSPSPALHYTHNGGAETLVRSPRDGLVYLLDASGEVHTIDTNTGAYAYRGSVGGTVFGYESFGGATVSGNSLIVYNTSTKTVTYSDLAYVQETPPTLASVITDCVANAGLDAADIDVSAITDTVDGYLIDSRQTVRDDLEPLMQAYQVIGVESDWKLKFTKRGSGSAVAVTESELGARNE